VLVALLAGLAAAQQKRAPAPEASVAQNGGNKASVAQNGGNKASVAQNGGNKPSVAQNGRNKASVGNKVEGDWHARHGLSFQRNWGVDIVGVRRVSSGLMLRFDYRVVDPEKASVLTDRKARPYLIDEATGAALAVPAMENIGELRQVAPLETTRTYFMIFGNPGGLVKQGGRVTLVVGTFRAEGLEVN
jgi:hypothetical protein